MAVTLKSSPIGESAAGPGPVLFLLNTLAIGGSERKTVAVVNELRRNGWDVHVGYLTGRTDLLDRLNSEVPTIHLGREGKLSLTAIGKLHRYIRRASIARVVCVNLYPIIYATAAVKMLPKSRRPSVILLINVTELINRKARMQMLVYRPLIRNAQRLVFGCRAQLDLWQQRYGLDAARCSVIYNGVDDGHFAPAATSCSDLEASDKDFVIGTVGRLKPAKNQGELISLMARLRTSLPHARLVIVGQGSERDALQAAAVAYGVSDRISFVGQQRDVRPALMNMDVFVLPSISETFSNAALEAMSMGTPVILSNTGGAREMVNHSVNGYLYQQGDIDALEALVCKLAADPAHRRAIGSNARATVTARFSFSRMILDYKHMLLSPHGR